MNRDSSVDIIIPLYNEEAILATSVVKLVDFLQTSSFPYLYTITLANNASTDSSWLTCLRLAEKYPGRVRALDIGAKGKGLAIRKAWEKSSANHLVFMDTDLSSDISALKPLVDIVAIHKNDMAIGNRLGAQSVIISDKALRKFASRFYNMVVRGLLGSPFDDHQCGFKVMNKKSFDKISPHLTENGFFFDTELVAVSRVFGYKIKSLDIVWRDSPSSKVSLFKDSLKMFFDVLRLKARLKNIQLL